MSLHRKEVGMERGSHLRGNLVSVQTVVPIFFFFNFCKERELNILNGESMERDILLITKVNS